MARLFLIATLFSTFSTGVAHAATWLLPALIAPQLVTTSVSGPSTTFRAAVGGANASVYDGAQWSMPVPVADNVALQTVACRRPGRAPRLAGTGLSRPLPAARGPWARSPAPSRSRRLRPTTTFCRALDVHGGEFLLDHGSRSAGAPTGVTSVVAGSCRSTSFCAALEAAAAW